ncbi:30S ribosomal protein S7 [Candidatus Riesia pediculischaeffi]|uniref:Small ribosomal subunit protein uS7 n=2 Tax=Candidatus Riesia pediculischaeffi TaxID=428411 RepID=A0A1V0HK55_9ENTR|nr:30S ribosomal protein S7 [Candidatus Riesia pediculischaeffi]ARC53206.1 30S ribosomal protein S7 [Candidatus Riesia pediculischaeffi]KIE64150.1 SSU ribosomal protein S7p (S5e) [Candidatus Riesia pediculischaeffi PTSU]
MPRKKITLKRKISPDFKYHSTLLTKFMNILMKNGKKSVAESIVYKSLNILSKRVNMNQIDSFEMSLSNVRPTIEVKSRRVGGSTYQVPVEIRSVRRDALAMRWIINSARKRKDKSMILKLTNELKDAIEQKGSAIRKKEEMHKIAEANKAFAHYRW